MGTAAKAMEFETTPVKPAKLTKRVGRGLTRKMALEAIEPVGSLVLLGVIIRRHKVGLLMTILAVENAVIIGRLIS